MSEIVIFERTGHVYKFSLYFKHIRQLETCVNVECATSHFRCSQCAQGIIIKHFFTTKHPL